MGNKMYGIFRDIPKASDIKIHSSDCSFYRIQSAQTTDWHYTNDLARSTEIARNLSIQHSIPYRDCKFCRPHG